jgi:hypothetical protein
MNNKKVYLALFVVTFVFSSIYMIGMVVPVEINDGNDVNSSGSETAAEITTVVEDIISEIEDEPSTSTGFYDGIGRKYTVYADDGIRLRMLRYHAPGKSFNYGSQPVLLFSGLGCNMNQFLQHTTPELVERYGKPTLPTNLADWAKGDTNIEEDPMLYYSIAYYMWSQGYDPWFLNYRGTGYGDMKSEVDDPHKVSIDVWALRDVRAGVRKVNAVTGKHPFIGGHSTGGLVGIMYLQGCKFGWDGMVRSSSSLKKERNGITKGPETVKGFIGLDPAMIPIMNIPLIDSLLVWSIVNLELYLDLRGMIETLLDAPIIGSIMDLLIGAIAGKVGDWFADIFRELMNLDTTNINEEIMFFLVAYAADSMYFRVLGHFLDFLSNKVVREHFKNGWFNKGWIKPPTPRWWDSYYYYTDNMRKISAPTICFLGTHENEFMDLVDGDQIIRDLMNGKTRHVYDECYWIAGAHIDVPMGIRAPVDLFPKLGNWLAKI